jgi:hypothetical protein
MYCTGDCRVVDIYTDWATRNLGFYNLQRPESKERMSSRETERTEDITVGDRSQLFPIDFLRIRLQMGWCN